MRTRPWAWASEQGLLFVLQEPVALQVGPRRRVTQRAHVPHATDRGRHPITSRSTACCMYHAHPKDL